MTNRKGQHYMFNRETTSKESHAELAENAESVVLLLNLVSPIMFFLILK
jgi:hypothetical protein